MCDIESYIYMPMLEETDYMPTRKYASGEEIRLHAERIVDKYELRSRAMFQSSIKAVKWIEATNGWDVEIQQKPKGGEVRELSIRSDFVILANGILNEAKLPRTEGSEVFGGEMFHTARWRYDLTGGSPTDARLEKLKDKRVAIIGTGESSAEKTIIHAQH
jgi:cation diffusion facilitator CzcD-associated flavoprotein CzcO